MAIQPGDLVQVGHRLALVLESEHKRLRVQYESDGECAHVSRRNATCLAENALHNYAIGSHIISVGDQVRARTGAEDGEGPGEWVKATVHAILRADAIDDSPPSSSGAEIVLAPAIRFGVRFDDLSEAWRRLSEVQPLETPLGDEDARPSSRTRKRAPLPAVAVSAAGSGAGGAPNGDAATEPGHANDSAADVPGKGKGKSEAAQQSEPSAPVEGGSSGTSKGKARRSNGAGKGKASSLAVAGAGSSAQEALSETAASAGSAAPAEPHAQAQAQVGPRAFNIGGMAPLPGEGGNGRPAAGPRAFNIGGMAALPGEGGALSQPGRSDEASGWCGPWSTARKMLREQPAAQEARKRQLEEAAAAQQAEQAEPWIPAKRSRAETSGRPASLGTTLVPSLQSLCVSLVAAHIDSVSSFGPLPMSVLATLQAALARRRALTPEHAHLFADPNGCVSELCLDDCCMLPEEAMLSLLSALGNSSTRVTVLCLGSAGRAFSQPSAALLAQLSAPPPGATSAAGGGTANGTGGGSFAIEHLSLGGCYRLSAAALCSLLSCDGLSCRLRTLQLTYTPLVDATVTKAIASACAGRLRSLALDHCSAVDDGALLQLLPLSGLTELSVAGLAQMSAEGLTALLTAQPEGRDEVWGGSLELLSLAENEQLTNEALIVIAAHCVSKLHTLDLSALHALTDEAVGACVLNGANLRCLRLRGIHELTDEPIVALAERRGNALAELSLNGCPNISAEAVRALETHCAAGLVALDLSWCRRISDDALGRLADACADRGHWGPEKAHKPLLDGPGGRALLPSLKLWGMTQLTSKFHNDHSLPADMIEGTPYCTHLQVGAHARSATGGGQAWSVRTRELAVGRA